MEYKMKLSSLIEKLDYELYSGSVDCDITTLTYDSRKVEEGSLFVCISGAVRDAHDFIPDVIEKGAKAIIIEKDVEKVEGVTFIKVANSREALAITSAASSAVTTSAPLSLAMASPASAALAADIAHIPTINNSSIKIYFLLNMLSP